MIGPQDVFQQCHEHLRVAEKRRDVAVGVLVTFVLAVLAVLRNAQELELAIKIAFTIIAVCTFTLLGLYRRWKLIHLHAASIFMELSRGDTPPTKEQAKAGWDKIIEKSGLGFRLTSGDLWLLLIAAVFSAVIAVPLFADKLSIVIGCNLWFVRILVLVAWVLIAYLTNYWATRGLDSFPDYAWMFRELESSNNAV